MGITNLEEIHKITAAVEITPNKEILVNGQLAFSPESDPYMQVPGGKILFNALHQLIYSRFYIQPCQSLPGTIPSENELQDTIALLSKANSSVVGFDEGWKMENTKENEFLVACKDRYRIQLKPGEFLNVRAGSDRQNNTREIKIYRPKEYACIHEAFYYAYGNNIYNSDDDFMVRFYFNAGFSGNVKLVKLLTAALNENELQFIFKCLIHPYYYGRSDTSVLYVNKQDADVVCDLIKTLYPEMEDSLRDGLPLFVYPVEKGIGFAEQPYTSSNESFGTHWSKIIAAGIMNAYENNLEKEQWPGEVLKHIQVDHGYSDRFNFYKNPQSHYPYSFIKE